MDLRNKARHYAGEIGSNDRVEYLSTGDLRREIDELRTDNVALLKENERLRMERQALETIRDRYEALYRHVQFLREQEKYTFSRAIHDELSQVLAVLKMELCWLEEHFDSENTPVRRQFDNLKKLLDHTIRASKQITSDLRPYMLDELGLASAVKWAAKEFKNRSGIETELVFAAPSIKFEKQRATAAFRIVQELLDNVERHAGASKVTIRMHTENDCLVLEVIDNGCGISRPLILSTVSFGLMGIRERTREFGGDVAITGKPGAGTRVTVSIPI